MRVGATTTLRQGSSQVSGSHQICPDQKKRGKFTHINTKLISFFDVEGIVHREFVPPGKTVNQQFYLNELKRPCESLR